MNWRAMAWLPKCVMVAAVAVAFSAAAANAQDSRDGIAVSGDATELCGFGFDVRINRFALNEGLQVANRITFRKNCSGPVLGIFSGESFTGPDGRVSVHMRATCLVASGPEPCTVGEVIWAAPGRTFLRVPDGQLQTNTVQMVWDDLGTGRWRFELLADTVGTAYLQFRTFTVHAYH